MSFLEQVQTWSFFEWVRYRQFVSAAIEGSHLASVGIFFGAIVLLDLRIAGVARGLIVPRLARHTLAIALVAFVWVTISGLYLFGSSGPKWLNTPEFSAKMILIVVGGANAAALHFGVWRTVDVWGAEGRSTPLVAKVLALGSISIWIAVIILGRLLGYVGEVPVPSAADLDVLLAPGGPLDQFR